MTSLTFIPVVYVKEDCPFCVKLRLFLLEAGLLSKVQLRGTSVEDEDASRTELRSILGKVSFPTAQIAPERYLTGSDDIVGYFAELARVNPDRLPTFKAYVEGPLQLIRGGRPSRLNQGAR
jgi:glutaredoxin 2